MAWDTEVTAARIEAGSATGNGITLLKRGSSIRLSWAQMYERSQRMARVLQLRGVEPGSIVVIATAELESLVTCIEAVWLLGATVTVLPPLSSQPDPHRIGATERLRKITPTALVYDGSPNLRRGWLNAQELMEAAKRTRSDHIRDATCDASARAIVQFTSGSTGDAAAIGVTHHQLACNHASIIEGAHLDLDDTFGSWLPLYHDMGLIGFFSLQMCEGFELVLAATDTFARSPRSWMRWLDRFRVTVTGGQSFAYGMAARVTRPGTLDLSALRLGFNGSEPIDVHAARSFTEMARANKLDRDCTFCVYGLAEATLAVTFPDKPGLQTETVNRRDLEALGVANRRGNGSDSVELALLGAPLPNVRLRIVSDDGLLVDPGVVGAIQVSGPAITAGYVDGNSNDGLLTPDGWLETGDLGYETDGQLAICGRRKEVIITAGRNLYPAELERSVRHRLDPVRPRALVIFGVNAFKGHQEEVVVAVERVARISDENLRAYVRAAVREIAGLSPRDVRVVERHAIPRTSSGKVRRQLCRELYESGDL